MTALVFMIIAIVLTLGIVGFGIYKVLKIIKSPTPLAINYHLEVLRLTYLALASMVSTVLIFALLAIYHEYPLKAGEWVELILGSMLFGFSLPAGVYTFILHYYSKAVPEKLNKWLFRWIIVGAIFTGVGLLLVTNGIADYLDYPLVNGINFQEGFTYPGSVKPNLAWYAICILSGAILVYVICDHRFYVEYGKHGILESTFFIAFPAGIIGARIGYVIGEWNHSVDGALSFAQRVAMGEWWAPFAIWEGGLTIISGALIGIIVGVLWFIWRNRKYSIWLAVDVIVPCILVAQAIGRWGNFFNAEVHGYEVLKADWWFLPKIIANNAAFSEKVGEASTGMIFMPLFFLEFLSNLTGYFVMRFALGKGLRKYLELGDLAFSYLIWYGLTRVIMEPLRHPAYNMGQDGYWSWFWSFVFVGLGALAIFGNHLVRFFINKETKYKKVNIFWSAFVTGVLVVGAAFFVIFGAINMAKGEMANFIAFSDFNNGLIELIIGVSMLLIGGCSLLYLIKGFKLEEKDA